MTTEIQASVKNCQKCEEFCFKPREPLANTPLPERLWWRLAVDLCVRDGDTYMDVVDYYSRFITVEGLKETTEAG